MSNYCNLYCKTCGEYSKTDINHGERILRNVVKVAPGCKIALEADKDGYLSISVLNYGFELIDFAIEHGGHDLKIEDEYGKHLPLNESEEI